MKSAAKKSASGRPGFGVLLLAAALSFAACEKNENLGKVDANVDANAAFMGVIAAYSHSLDISQEDGVAKVFGEEIADRAWDLRQRNGGARPVYGEDDRKHYWEIEGARERGWADATCLATVNAPAQRSSGSVFGLVELPGGEYRLKTALIKGTRIPGETGILPDLNGSVPMCGVTDADRSTAGFGTAWLAKADVVVTAGHVVAKARGIQNLAFVFGYRVLAKGQAPETVVKREQVYHAVSFLGNEYYGGGDHRDFAVIRLDRAVPESVAKPLAVSNLDSIPDGTRIGLIGYPNGLPQRSAFGDLTRAFGLEQSQRLCYVTNLDSFAGNSGSPVIDPDKGEVIGILIRGKKIEYALEPGARCFDKISLSEAYKPSELVLKASCFRSCLAGLADHH